MLKHLLRAGFILTVTLLPELCGFRPLTVRAQAPCEETPTACPQRLDTETARGLALGLGLRASAMSTSALAYNPAALVLARLYHLEGSVDYIDHANTVALGGAVADSATSALAGAVSLRGFLSEGDGGYDGLDGRLGIAFPLASAFALGASVRYVNIGTEVRNPSTDELEDQELVEGFTFDASMAFTLADSVQIAVMGYNLINRNSELLPRMVGLSAALVPMAELSLGVDSLLDFTTFENTQLSLGGGLEYLLSQRFPLRAGYLWDNPRNLHFVTFGLGYTDPIAGLDVSLRQGVSGTSETRLLASLRLYVNN